MIRIVLVDDHAVVRDGLQALLETHPDFTVVGSVGSGQEAVRQVEQCGPDVVIMDIAMRDMNGIEATQEIRRTCPSTQVVILSVHATAEYIFRALQAGARGYLLKASAGMELVEAVRAVHAGHRYLSHGIAETVIDDYLRQESARPEKSPLERLTARERTILQFLAEGHSNAEIAATLNISPKTVDTHRHRLMKKLGISGLAGLVRFAIQHGLTPLD